MITHKKCQKGFHKASMRFYPLRAQVEFIVDRSQLLSLADHTITQLFSTLGNDATLPEVFCPVCVGWFPLDEFERTHTCIWCNSHLKSAGLWFWLPSRVSCYEQLETNGYVCINCAAELCWNCGRRCTEFTYFCEDYYSAISKIREALGDNQNI